MLFTLLTHNCASRYVGNQIIKFADDMRVVGLIHRKDESMYREDVKHLESWIRVNNLVLSADKAKEMIIALQEPSSYFKF